MNIQGNLGDYANVTKPAIKSDLTAYFEIFDFKIPVTSDGRRIWSPKFKTFVTEGIHKRAFSAGEVAKLCNINVSMVHGWSKEVRRSPQKLAEHSIKSEPDLIFGYSVPKTNDGRRLWPHELKRLVVDKLVAGEMKAKALARACDVDSSMIYQWKMEVEGKLPKVQQAQPEEPMFAEVQLVKPSLPKPNIRLRKGDLLLELPPDYPPVSIAKIMAAL